MTDLRIQFSEEMVGAGHPAKADTMNRLALVEHNTDGTHKSINDVMAYADLPTAIATIGSASTTLLISTSQTLTDNLTVPTNITLSFIQGATITIPTTKTLYIKGTVDAGNYVIFAGAGTVDMNEGDRVYNLAWFEGASLDLKWDFARRGLINTVPYTAIIPHPREADPAAIETGSGKWRWDLAAPLLFDDPENFGEWYIYGQIWATASMDSMMKFSPTNKTEDIRFQTRVDIYGNDVATTGVKIVNGAARIFFNDELHIHNVVTCVEGATGLPIGFCEINKIYAAFFSNAVIDINATAPAVIGFKVNSIYAEEATNAAAVGVRLSGNVRNVEIGHINYYQGVGAIPLAAGVELEATADGRPWFGIKIGSVYAYDMAVGVKSYDSSGGSASKINSVRIGPVFTAPDAVTTAVDLDWIVYSHAEVVSYNAAITLGANSIYCSVDSPASYSSITNSGSYNTINGSGTQAAGAGVAPNTAQWKIGSMVMNSSDTTVWWKWRHTGVSADDFIKLN